MRQKKDSNQNKKGAKRSNKFGFYFLDCVVALYFVFYFIRPDKIKDALQASVHIFIQIIPVFFLILLLMWLLNLLLRPKTILKYVGKESGIKGWFIAVSTGILSHGPIYVWFPLLKDLREQGMSNGLVSAFLYCRAIKIPLLPMMVFYFGPSFTIVLFVYMLIASLIQGRLMELVLRKN